MASLKYRHESHALIFAPVEQVFAHMDDHTRMSGHMNESSWKMGGGRMATWLDANRGRAVGSRIRLAGRAFGFDLCVEEVVVEREPPSRKVWATTGVPQLVVIGHYRMGFDLSPEANGSRLRVFIEYALPEKAPIHWLWRLLAGYYARWCTQRMVDDVARQLARSAEAPG